MTAKTQLISAVLCCFITTSALATTIVDSMEYDGVIYLLVDGELLPSSVKRYEFASNTFLPDIALDERPSHFWVNENGVYVGSGTDVDRYTLSGGNQGLFLQGSSEVSGLLADGNTLFVFYGKTLKSVNASTAIVLDEESIRSWTIGHSIEPVSNKIFALSNQVSPRDVISIEYSFDGTLSQEEDSPYHGAYPIGSQTHISPDGGSVIDDQGIAYLSSDLSYEGSFGGSFLDIGYWGDQPVVLREGILEVYDSSRLFVGHLTIPEAVERIHINAPLAILFSVNQQGTVVSEQKDLNSAEQKEPAAAVDPNSVSFTIDQIFVDDLGEIAYISSNEHPAIFRWSLLENRYLASIALTDTPLFIALSSELNRLYVAYDGGTINKIELDSSFTESGMASLPSTALGMAVAGDFLFAVDASGAWNSHYTFDSLGQPISAVEWSYFSEDYVWNPYNNKIFYFRDSNSPNDLISEEIDPITGVISNDQDSPYHGDFVIRHPIVIGNEGRQILLGSGDIYDADSLEVLGSIANQIDGGIWIDDKWLTVVNELGNSRIQLWSAGTEQLQDLTLPGEFVALRKAGDKALLLNMPLGELSFKSFSSTDFGDRDGDQVIDLLDAFPDNGLYQLDTDLDGIANKLDADDDGDGLPDDWETTYGMDPLVKNDGDVDTDGDGYSDLEEFEIGTNPLNRDTDGDSYEDKNDAFPLLASEHSDIDIDGIGDNSDPDIDGDGVLNELDAFPSNPDESVDTDGDSIGNNSDPDSDNDGIENQIEIMNGMDPLLQRDAFYDIDLDGLTNLEELSIGTSINNSDSDLDLIPDGLEHQLDFLDPLAVADTDVGTAQFVFAELEFFSIVPDVDTAQTWNPITLESRIKVSDTEDLGRSVVATLIEGPAILSFTWGVSSQPGSDILSLTVGSNSDGKIAISGEVSEEHRVVEIPHGKHYLIWEYEKDSFWSQGSDEGWISNIQIDRASSEPPQLEAASTAEADSDSKFYGGVTLRNGSEFFDNFSSDEHINVIATIEPNSRHVLRTAQVYILVIVEGVGTFQKTPSGGFDTWNGDLSLLQAFHTGELRDKESFILLGNFRAADFGVSNISFEFYVAYTVDGSTLYYNKTPISFDIN